MGEFCDNRVVCVPNFGIMWGVDEQLIGPGDGMVVVVMVGIEGVGGWWER